jgi:MFS family permease
VGNHSFRWRPPESHDIPICRRGSGGWVARAGYLGFAALNILAYIDRINVSFAGLTMRGDLHLSATDFGFALGTFFLGYFIFEVPSNVIMEKVGARLWIARIMITWGIFAGAMAFVFDTTSFSIVRFLLGVAEAGFFPGMLLYFTYGRGRHPDPARADRPAFAGEVPHC